MAEMNSTSALARATTKQMGMPPKPKRMALDSVTDGPVPFPWMILVYGPEGVGKSTLAVDLADSITLDVERSANKLRTKKFPTPLTLQDVYDAIEILYTQEHLYKRLVIDTVDRLEALVFAHVVATAKARGGSAIHSIEDFGYGKGFQVALDEWRKIVARLDELRSARGMDILLLGHTFIKNFKNPDGPDYDRYTLRLNEKAGGFIKECCDAVLFARYEETTTQIGEKGRERTKGVTTGARFLYTERSAAFDAKNRFNLPEQLPLSWRELETAMKGATP